MSLDSTALAELADTLSRHPAILEKAGIDYAYAPAKESAGNIALGDDCAAIPDPVGGGHLLFAAEGMLPAFVESDPWFAGYSAVMVNLSDIAAMGGRPIAVTDILASPNERFFEQIWNGMRAASEAYGVPIVGGHTTRVAEDQPAGLAAAVLGRAGDRLITSFDAHPGDHLVMAIDMSGSYRGDAPFWNATTTTSPDRLRADLDLLPKLAEHGHCRAGKDISNGGIIGTLAMLCHCSKVGATLDMTLIPRPLHTSWAKWFTSFPSFGYLLAISDVHLSQAEQLLAGTEITMVACGSFLEEPGIELRHGDDRVALPLNC